MRTRVVTLVIFATLVASCSSAQTEEIVLRDFDGNAVSSDNPASTTTPPPESTTSEPEPEPEPTSTTSSAPDQLVFSTNEIRRTNEGIEVGLFLEETDFGDGPFDAWWLRSPSAGLIVDMDLRSQPSILTTAGWVVSGGHGLMRVEVGQQITEVRLTGSQGVDRVAPDETNFAVLAVRAEGPEDMAVEALNASGEVEGSCSFDGTLFQCPS